MKIIDTIKEHTIKYFLSALFGLLILLIGLIYQDVLLVIYPEVIQKLPKEVFLKITIVAIILFVLSSVLSLIFYLKLKNKLIPKFGVLWDKKGEAYCPSCEIILSEYHEQTSPLICSFTCVKCHTNIRLNNLGKSISLLDAQKLLNS